MILPESVASLIQRDAGLAGNGFDINSLVIEPEPFLATINYQTGSNKIV